MKRTITIILAACLLLALCACGGGGGSAETCFGGEGQSSELKRILDNLIANGEMEPLLVVTPTFYPMDNADNSVSTAGELAACFPDELANDLIPTVEPQYSTYAETTDPQGLTASRGHRAFGGFSMGAVTTWSAIWKISIRWASTPATP